MPFQKVKGGIRWGEHGHVYHGKGAHAKAARQMRAEYANGYRGKHTGAKNTDATHAMFNGIRCSTCPTWVMQIPNVDVGDNDGTLQCTKCSMDA